MKRSKQKTALEKFAATDAILESISDGVFTVDGEWRVRSFNRAAETITGVPREEAIGRRCDEVFRSSLCGAECALQQAMQTGGRSSEVGVHRHRRRRADTDQHHGGA